jgi:DNA-directed RNA polymerase subunit RPC12/RpoP
MELSKKERMYCSKCGEKTEHFWNVGGDLATCAICGKQVEKPKEYGEYITAFCRECGKRVRHRLTDNKRLATCLACGAQFPFRPAKGKRT